MSASKTIHDLGISALNLEERAAGYDDMGQPELAAKIREASTAALDAAFPSSDAERDRASATLCRIADWLQEYERKL